LNEIADMKIIKSFVAILFLTMTLHAFSQKSINVPRYNCFSTSVNYFIDGEDREGILIFINYNDIDMPALQHSDAFILTKNRENIRITNDSCLFTNICGIKVSEDNKYVALFMVGEGHPWIEIYDLQKLIFERKQVLIATINPYPGYVNMLKWKDDFLIIESDANLLLLNENKDLTETENFEKSKKFRFNIHDKKYSDYK
jgi:hypothetical protein